MTRMKLRLVGAERYNFGGELYEKGKVYLVGGTKATIMLRKVDEYDRPYFVPYVAPAKTRTDRIAEAAAAAAIAAATAAAQAEDEVVDRTADVPEVVEVVDIYGEIEADFSSFWFDDAHIEKSPTGVLTSALLSELLVTIVGERAGIRISVGMSVFLNKRNLVERRFQARRSARQLGNCGLDLLSVGGNPDIGGLVRRSRPDHAKIRGKPFRHQRCHIAPVHRHDDTIAFRCNIATLDLHFSAYR